jgi:exodeoxyribonuclease V alpha subunit
MSDDRPLPHLARHLGALLGELAGQHAPLVAAAADAALTAFADGDVCTGLGSLDQHGDATTVRRQLLASAAVCTADAAATAPAPLVLDAADRLYLLRHFRDEQALLQFVSQRLAAAPRHPPAALRAGLADLGLLPEPPRADRQLAAIVAAVSGSFTVLTGGPGTGKTYTIARLLALLLHLEPSTRIALCAPTGKAASRLQEALHQAASTLPPLADARIQSATLHRLLGYLPLDDTFRSGPDRMLPFDVVVVDEASMAEPALLAWLCSALSPTARLVLVGDQDQLAAVGAGQVLGDLCAAARPHLGVGPQLAEQVAAATGARLPVQANAAPIADAVVALTQNHRFAAQPGIGAFAQALARRDQVAALAALQAGHADLQPVPRIEAGLESLAETFAAMRDAAEAGDAAQALHWQRQGRVLTAGRSGPHGAEGLNRRVERLLAARGHFVGGDSYPGRPILVTANDHQSQIYNGDLGVVVRHDGQTKVAFDGPGGPRLVPLLRVPTHETAWAMTVHKAQGSEFAQVLLVMPDQDSPLWQAALVYTGITRARQRAILCADPTLLAAGLQRWPTRRSGLAAGLAAGTTTAGGRAQPPSTGTS